MTHERWIKSVNLEIESAKLEQAKKSRQAPDLTRVEPQILDEGSTSQIYPWSKSKI